MDNLIGKKLDGRYLIESLIGVGGMANVYRGRDVRTGNGIAVKVLKEEFLGNEELVRRFKNESKAISILDHPNIVKVYDVSVTDQLQYIVMEYIDGITLKEYLKQRGGALTWKEVVHFATQVLSALDHAHSKGIVHRDVKPQNIMLQADGSIKMMDFGIARFSRAQSQTVSDKAIGSVHYISPEQAKGDRTDARTDIYSVGVMLYEMLSGRLPFDGTGTVSIAIMQISEKPKPLAQIAPTVPEGLRQITEKAMEKDPAARYQSAAEMLAAIKAFKQNPSIRFEYEYNTSDAPGKTINKVVSGSTKSGISTQQARRAGAPAAGGKAKNVKNAKSRTAAKEKPFSVLPVFFGMAVAFMIGAAILIYLIFTNSTNPLFSNRANVQLVDFVGMTEDEFRATEYFSLLDPDIIEEYNSNYAAGVIFQQSPAAGRTVKEQQKITLKVSLGTEYVTLVDVAGEDKATAKQTLTDLGVSVVTKRETNDSVAEGTVIRTDPAAGTQVEGGSTVILYVARPTVNTSVIVPSVEGMDDGKARSELRSMNLVTKVITQPSDQPEGTVLSQNPSAGTEVTINSVVVLYVSSGIPEVVVDPGAGGDVLNGDPNTIVKEWYEDLGDGNVERRWKTGDGNVYGEQSGFLYNES